MVKRLRVFDNALRAFFYRLGKQVGLTPGYFIIVPILLTALAASGLQRIVYEADPEYLFSPSDGRAKSERRTVEEHFPTTYTDFDPGRLSRFGKFGRLIVEAKDNGTILRERIFNQILIMDELVRNITFYDDLEGRNFTFVDLCALSNGYCWDNLNILNVGRYVEEIEAGDIRLTYPIWFDIETFESYELPFFMGGLELDEDGGYVTSAKAISLIYFLNSETDQDVARGKKWELAFLKVVQNNAPKFPDINVYQLASQSLEMELELNCASVIPYFSFNVGVMIAFCVVTCMMADWVKSKPYLGLFGVVSAMMGTVTAFGLCIYFGVPFIGINLAAPFLMLGIGIDDTFVMLGAWRRTSAHKPVPERLASTFSDAAASITITSVTDMLSFWIGMITPFPSVKIFCLYAGTSVTFTYLWHVTFFGACMAISGFAEKNNKHSLVCVQVVPRSLSKGKGFFYNVFCSGGINPKDPWNEKDNRENMFMVFFRDVFAAAINKFAVKVVILVLFSGYLATSVWAIFKVETGLERKHLARYDSYSVSFYEAEDLYFKEYPYRVSVIINGRVDYSNKSVQDDMERLLKTLENHTNVDPLFTESWLKDFLSYVKRNEQYENIDISTEEKFVETLNTSYLSSGSTYAKDVSISADGKIVGSRFMVQAKGVYSTNDDQKFLLDIRNIVDSFPYDVQVFNPYFIYVDQFIAVLPTTIQCVTIAAVVMMVISLIFIPDPMCSLWVAFSIVSIELGVVAFMSLWAVRLDTISMINLIMCIGFSVDFSAHICYQFTSHKNMNAKGRVTDSLYALGLPISQGAVSTVFGVVTLAVAPSYIFLTFFKMVVLVIVLGALHGLVLLPVLLSLFGSSSCSVDDGKSKDAEISDESGATCNSCSVSVSTDDKQENCTYNSHGHKHFSQNLRLGDEIRIPRPSTIKAASGSIDAGGSSVVTRCDERRNLKQSNGQSTVAETPDEKRRSGEDGTINNKLNGIYFYQVYKSKTENLSNNASSTSEGSQKPRPQLQSQHKRCNRQM